MTEQADAFDLGDLVEQRDFERIVAVELHRAVNGGPQAFHRDPKSVALREFIDEHPGMVSWCKAQDESDNLPAGTSVNIVTATLMQVIGKMESELMAMADRYAAQLPYPRLCNQLLILAAQEIIENLLTEPVCENK